ncbi:MAG: hypothetical protein VR67_11445 [Peptococcaceae bacterium BRH_c8a]|nr:MAG: hypothetical protein VR67_11445 [Peptococcaceae bacterium BRH_c8a]
MVAKKKKPDLHKDHQQNQTKPKDQFEALHQVAFWGLAALLFFPPYFRGLFFAPEQEKALIFTTLVFWLAFLWRWLQNDHKFLRGPLDWFALALPVVYIISSFTAVNKGLAIDEVVKNILYFLTYWSASRLIRNQEDIHKLLHVIYISAIGVALAGMATAMEIIHIKDGFNVSHVGGFISSTFQYHNALAAYLGAVVLIGFYLWNYSMQRQHNELAGLTNLTGQKAYTTMSRINPLGYLYACGNFLLLAVLLGSKSRGGLLVFGLVFVIYLLGTENKRKIVTLLLIGFLGVISNIVINKFITLAQDKQYDIAWLWVLGGLLIAISGQIFITMLERHVISRWSGNPRKYIISFTAIIIVTLLVAGVWLTGKPQVLEKATSFEYLWTAYQRLYYMESSIDMIQERPLIGWGGGGWKEAYESYLSYRYTTREAHSYPFQVGVETGIVGMITVIGIWLSFLLLVIRQYRESKDNPLRRQLVWLFGVTFLMIGGHALIDFDLSLSALALVLWSIFGIAAALAYPAGIVERKKQMNLNYAPLGVSTIVMLLIMICSAFLAQAASFANQASTYFRTNKPVAGVEYLEKAKAYNPFNSNHRISLSQAYMGQGEKTKALEEAKSAANLSRYNFGPRINYVQIAFAAGNNELATSELEKTLELAPNNIETYEQYAINYLNFGINELTAGNKDIARAYLNKAVAVTGLITRQANSLNDIDKKMWSGPLLEVNDKIRLITGQANYCLGNFNESQERLQQAHQTNNNYVKTQALLWLALIEEKNGNLTEHKNLIDQANSLNPELTNNFSALKNIPVL